MSNNGQLTEGPRLLLQKFNFNEDGTRKELTNYKPDGSIAVRTVEVYDLEGRILESSTFIGQSDHGSRITYKYDSSKRWIEIAVYRPEGTIAHRTIFTYQGDQRFGESVNYDASGAIVSRGTGVDDLKAHRSEMINQSANEVVRRQTSITDTRNGQVYEQRVNGALAARSLSTASRDGVSEFTTYNPDGSVKSKQRNASEFDSHGNAVKTVRSEMKSGADEFRPVAVYYRTFEYYGKN
jgi:hypothetical protein